MNVHEYQGKEILAMFGVGVQRGIVATTPEEATAAARQLTDDTGTGWHVIKAQVHAGGRGKGGGVKLAKSLEEVARISEEIIGMQLVTPQTTAEGKKVHQVLVAEDVYYPGDSEPEEIYISVLLNRTTGRNMIMYSTEGGMDIEKVAEETPELIFAEEINPTVGLLPFQARKVAFNLGLSGLAFKGMVKFVTALYKAYVGADAALFEINPVLKTSDDKIIAVDAKVTLDDNALFRHPDFAAMRDIREENPTDVAAREVGLNYMATMDLIKQAGGDPANFLDVGGTADAARVEAAFRIILQDPKVKAILVNIFGGIVRCDRVAQGIVDAYKNMGDAIQVPIIVRLQGTNADIAKQLIDDSGLEVQSAILFQEAADKVQEVV